MTYSIKMYRKQVWANAEIELEPVYKDYEATFKHHHPAEIYMKACQENLSVSQIDLINDETGEVTDSFEALKVKRSGKFNDVYWSWSKKVLVG